MKEEIIEEIKRQAVIRKWTAPELDYIINEALTTFEQSIREDERETILRNILKWSKKVTVVETTGDEGAKKATNKLRENLSGSYNFLFQAIKVLPLTPPNQ